MAKIMEKNDMTLDERKRNPNLACLLDSLTKTEAPPIMDAKLSVQIDTALILANIADNLDVMCRALLDMQKGENYDKR